MKIKGILSERFIKQGSSFQIVSEWEDAIANQLNIRKYYTKKSFHFIVRNIVRFKLGRLFVLFESLRPVKSYYLHFDMEATSYLRLPSVKNIIPIIIDFWLPKEEFKRFYFTLSNSKAVLITSREVYELLKQNSCPLRIIHFPLSIPDKYITIGYSNQIKTFDFVFAGRRDPIFFEYVKRYEEQNPHIEYVYKETDNETSYISNKRGKLPENYRSRDQYSSLIKSSRVAFYSTPGSDPSKANANGYNQVTPRFLELISNGCLVIARYTDNPDVHFFQLDQICFKVDSYQDFHNYMKLFSDSDFVKSHTQKYDAYLKKHSTSARMALLEEILNDN